MKKILFSLLFVICNLFGYSQDQYVHQILILNEGCYDYGMNEILEPVTIGVYDIETNTYNTIVEIENVRFASDLIIDEDYFYVAADNKILKYDLNSYDLLFSVEHIGVRKLMIYEEKLFVTRGEYDSSTFGPVFFESYLDVFLKDDLAHFLSFDTTNGPQWSTENLLINDNQLYVTINNAYEWGNYKGILGIVDLSNMTYTFEIDLGEDALNPINMMLYNNTIYTLNNKNWDGSSVSMVDLTVSTTPETMILSNVSAGCGVSIIRDEKFIYQKSNETELYSFSLENTEQMNLEPNFNYNYYALAENPLNGHLYAAIANFTSNSGVIIYDEDNNEINTFFADVATSKIVFDIRMNNNFSLKDDFNTNSSIVTQIDVLGRLVKNSNIIIEIYDNGDYKKKFSVNHKTP